MPTYIPRVLLLIGSHTSLRDMLSEIQSFQARSVLHVLEGHFSEFLNKAKVRNTT